MNASTRAAITRFISDEYQLFASIWRDGAKDLEDEEWNAVSDKWFDETDRDWNLDILSEMEAQLRTFDWSSVVQEQDDDDWMNADTGPLDDYDYFSDDQAFDSDRERRYGGGSAF